MEMFSVKLARFHDKWTVIRSFSRFVVVNLNILLNRLSMIWGATKPLLRDFSIIIIFHLCIIYLKLTAFGISHEVFEPYANHTS